MRVRLLLPIQPAAVLARGRLAIHRGVQPGGDVPHADAGDGGGADLQRGADGGVGPAGTGLALVGLQQDARMGQGAGWGNTPPDHGVQPGALGLR
jgi:hypothetical protein